MRPESGEFLHMVFDGQMEEFQLDGIKIALRGISRTRPSSSNYETQKQWDDFFIQSGKDLCGLVLALEGSPYQVQYIAGTAEVKARNARIEHDRTFSLLDLSSLKPGNSLLVDHAQFHHVAPDFARYDLPHEAADYRQAFIASSTDLKAVSLNQISKSLWVGADLKFASRPGH